MKLLYLENCEWEIDFIRYEILFDIPNLEFQLFKKDELQTFVNQPELVNNNILLINGVLNLDNVLNVVKVIKPIAIFFTSDESGDSLIKTNWIILEKYTPLFFRQYNHSFINYSANNYQIPLGYVKNFLNQKQSLNIIKNKMNQREINASFIGVSKSDRPTMKYIFENKMDKTNIKFVDNNWDINNMPYSQNDMFNIYNNSIFVINGRGNSTLDCFRIYEAVVAGAIPVIVGNISEISVTFNYNNNIPPFIFANTWDDAVILCNKLLNDLNNLQELQDKIFDWWKNLLNNLNSIIKNNINNLNTVNSINSINTVNKIETYKNLIDKSFQNAENKISKITNDIINLEGCTGLKTRHFYNNLLNTEDARYLEIGTWKGSSVCSAMCGNKSKVICIDNWSQGGGPKTEFLENFEKFKGENDATFIENDCYNVDVSVLPKFNIYMYDGNHTNESHYKALLHYYNCLDDIFIFIVDDWNWKDVRNGTNNAIEKLNLKILYEKEIRLTWDESHTPIPLAKDTWWNGMYVVILQK